MIGKKGSFIVVDGNDGSGKATQVTLLFDYFARTGVQAEKIDFPRYQDNFFGKLIGECLAGAHGDFLHADPKIASTLYALDRLESTQHIENALNEGNIIIADRFSSSNQIHQGGKISDDSERSDFLEWLDMMEHAVLKIPRPDAIIYLRVPPETSLHFLDGKRKAKILRLKDGQKDTVEADKNYLEKSYASANWLAKRQSNWHIVDCVRNGTMRTREDIHAEVIEVVHAILTSIND